MQRNIIDIFEKYDTDKREHGYPKYYQSHLPETATKILEVGVFKGSSIKMWHEIYPEAHIYGLDLFKENPIPFEADWVTWFQGSQRDGDLLGHIRGHGKFDIVIDDGSHNWRDQLITFFGLWGACDLYVCEDIHPDLFWSQGLPPQDNIKSLNVDAKIFNYEKIKFFYAP